MNNNYTTLHPVVDGFRHGDNSRDGCGSGGHSATDNDLCFGYGNGTGFGDGYGNGFGNWSITRNQFISDDGYDIDDEYYNHNLIIKSYE